MAYKVTKNGVTYTNGPRYALDLSRQGEERGRKLQELFNSNGIRFDLETGTGTDKDNFFFMGRDEYGKPIGVFPSFEDADYRTDRQMFMDKRNMAANEHFVRSIRKDVFNSDLYVFKRGEESPRKIFMNDKGEYELSEPIASFNLEKMKPSKPNIFKQIAHWMNKDWFKDDFDEYEKKTSYYDKYVKEETQVKSGIEQAKTDFEARKEIRSADENLLRVPESIDNGIGKFNERVENLLGPNPKDCPDLIEAGVYKKENFNFKPQVYPEGHPFTEHELSVMGFAALCDGEVAAMGKGNKYLAPEEIAIGNHTHLTDDILFGGQERHNSGNTFMSAYNPAREKVLACVISYQAGIKDYLAKMLGQCIKVRNLMQSGRSTYSHHSVSAALATDQVLDILKKNPELLAKSGLTEEDVKTVEANRKFAEAYRKMSVAQANLIRSENGEMKISDEQKKEYLLDIMSTQALLKIEQKHIADTKAMQKEQYEEAEKKTFDALKASSKLNTQIVDIEVKGGTVPEELRQKAEDAAQFNKACATKLSQIIYHRELSPAFRLFADDDENGTNYKEFRNKISETETFRNYMSKSIGELVQSQREINNTIPIVADTVKVLGELKEPIFRQKKQPEPEVKQPGIGVQKEEKQQVFQMD